MCIYFAVQKVELIILYGLLKVQVSYLQKELDDSVVNVLGLTKTIIKTGLMETTIRWTTYSPRNMSFIN